MAHREHIVTCPLCTKPVGIPDTPANREVLAFLSGVGAGHALGASSVQPNGSPKPAAAQVQMAEAIELLQACKTHGPAVDTVLLIMSLAPPGAAAGP